MFNIGKRYYIFEKGKFEEKLRFVLSRKSSTEWMSQLMAAFALAAGSKQVLDQGATAQSSALYVAGGTLLAFGALVGFVFSTINFRKWTRNRRFTKEQILADFQENQVEGDITYILIVKRDEGGIATFLVSEHEDWGLMFPYSKSIEEIDHDKLKTNVNGILPGSDFDIEWLPILDLNDEVKTNPRKSELARFSYRFVFLSCRSSYREFQNSLESDDGKRWVWKTMDDLYKDKKTVINNADVISHLNSDYILAMLSDSFPSPPSEADTIPKGLKVIWNITDKCSYGCAFCGTFRADSTESLTYKERLKVAVELRKIPNVKVDFAGGDPLGDEETVEAIRLISQFIIKEGVCITTTGKSMEKYATEELEVISREYDVSYDFPSRWDDAHRGDQYNRSNYKQLRRLGKVNIKRNVLVTLSATNTDERIIQEMATELNEIDPDEVTLLRLMPVGKQSYDNYPSKEAYNPKLAIDLFNQEYGGKTKLHCAFRADEQGGRCNMLVEKIGVDHLGNVFACAWAGYLAGREPQDNPFYLGNLVKQSMHDVFKSQKYSQMLRSINESDNNFCKIFSYVAGDDSTVIKMSQDYVSWTQ